LNHEHECPTGGPPKDVLPAGREQRWAKRLHTLVRQSQRLTSICCLQGGYAEGQPGADSGYGNDSRGIDAQQPGGAGGARGGAGYGQQTGGFEDGGQQTGHGGDRQLAQTGQQGIVGGQQGGATGATPSCSRVAGCQYIVVA